MVHELNFYDGMLESIQQFPLTANEFDREMSRLTKRYLQLKDRFKRLLKTLPDPEGARYKKLCTKLRRCILRKQKAVTKYRGELENQLNLMNEYNAISDSRMQLGNDNIEKAIETPAIIKMKSNGFLEEKHCICKTADAGNMICCEHPECPVQWYHISCANLQAVPVGKWICERCKKSNRMP